MAYLVPKRLFFYTLVPTSAPLPWSLYQIEADYIVPQDYGQQVIPA